MVFKPSGGDVLIIIFGFSIILTLLINYFYRHQFKYWPHFGFGLGIVSGIISTVCFIALKEHMWIEDGSECPSLNLGLFLPILIIPTVTTIVLEIFILRNMAKGELHEN